MVGGQGVTKWKSFSQTKENQVALQQSRDRDTDNKYVDPKGKGLGKLRWYLCTIDTMYKIASKNILYCSGNSTFVVVT